MTTKSMLDVLLAISSSNKSQKDPDLSEAPQAPPLQTNSEIKEMLEAHSSQVSNTVLIKNHLRA